jgi:UDP-glucose-4-epimerase GalE
MARVLIVGGAGFIGSHCAKAVAAAGHECVVYDNLSTGHRAFVKWGPLVQADIRDGAALARVFRDFSFDAVIHFAALAYVGDSVVDPNIYYDVNINGTRCLLDAMRGAGVSQIVFSSSCATYGQPERIPIREDMDQRPINPYGYTKLVCERMMDDFGVAYGLRSVKLRYFNAAGGDPDSEIGEDHDPETHIIPLILDAALGRRPDVRIFGSDYPTRDGTAVRDFIHVADLADAHLRALDYLLAGGTSDAFNLGTGSGISVAELVTAARETTNAEIRAVMSDRRPGDPAILVADCSKAGAVLDWRARRSDLKTILADAWAWRRK